MAEKICYRETERHAGMAEYVLASGVMKFIRVGDGWVFGYTTIEHSETLHSVASQLRHEDIGTPVNHKPIVSDGGRIVYEPTLNRVCLYDASSSCYQRFPNGKTLPVSTYVERFEFRQSSPANYEFTLRERHDTARMLREILDEQGHTDIDIWYGFVALPQYFPEPDELTTQAAQDELGCWILPGNAQAPVDLGWMGVDLV